MAKSPTAPPFAWQNAFLERHQLGADYLVTARRWFDPLVEHLYAQQKGANRALVVGINGCQGSGKTTLVDYLGCALEAGLGLRCARLSLDDFYLARAARQTLARQVHPLFATRGVPGTHDMPLMRACLQQLKAAQMSATRPLRLPRFDKAGDERCDAAQWATFSEAVDVVLFEGWCLGVEAQPEQALAVAVNELEHQEDASAIWRRAVNAVLARDFPPVYALVDEWWMLQAPSFACVQRWRQEQEDKLRRRLGAAALGRSMSPAQVTRFIQHYQRLTEWSLATVPDRADVLFRLDQRRHIVAGGV